MSDKPFTKLLRCYLLDQIAALPRDTAMTLKHLEPNLQKTYECSKSWDQIVAIQMSFPSDFPDQVRQLWQHNKKLAEEAHTTLDPSDFVDMLIKENFPFALD